MKLFVLIPVHNRIGMTTQCVNDLLNQEFDRQTLVVVIDDGSTDGTAEMLRQMKASTDGQMISIDFIKGNGDWWWSYCMYRAIEMIRPQLDEDDAVLFLNDDVRLDPNYLQTLTSDFLAADRNIIISQLMNIENHEERIDSAVRIDSNQLIIEAVTSNFYGQSKRYKESDAGPGRGTIYPAKVFLAGMNIDYQKMPHYVADYEFSVRARRNGMSIFCSEDALVYTSKDFGNSKKRGGRFRRLIAKESSERLLSYWAFWRTAAPELSSLQLIFRLLRYRIVPGVLGVSKIQK